MRALRPALPVTILIIIGGWMAAGVIITMSVAIGWPPVASAAIELPGWDWLAVGVGTLLFLGGWLVLMSGRKWHRLNMRWALELAGELLLLAAFAAYAILAAGTGSWSVVVVLVAHCAAVVWRIAEVRREEGLTRHLTAKHEERDR